MATVSVKGLPLLTDREYNASEMKTYLKEKRKLGGTDARDSKQVNFCSPFC